MEHESPPAAPKAEKPKKRLLWVFLIVALVLGAGAGGALAGPRWMASAGQPARSAEPAPSADAHGEEAVGPIAELGSIIVDSKTQEGNLRHIKVALAIELKEGHEPDAVKPYLPRAREATIRYLRTHGFEELSTPQHFERVAQELGESVRGAVGESRVKRVLITEFVAQ